MRRGFLSLALVACVSGVALAEDPNDDLARLQGAWVLTRHTEMKNTPAIRKEIDGTVETTRIVDEAGNTLHAQTSEFRVERIGQLRLLHWSNAKVTEGPRKGVEIPDGTAVFTFRGEKWISVIGLPDQSPFSVHTEIWSRPAPAAREAE